MPFFVEKPLTSLTALAPVPPACPPSVFDPYVAILDLARFLDNRVRFGVGNRYVLRARCSFSRPPSPVVFLPLPSSPLMSDRPPLREFLNTVLTRLSQGEEDDSSPAAWRQLSRSFVFDTLRVS